MKKPLISDKSNIKLLNALTSLTIVDINLQEIKLDKTTDRKIYESIKGCMTDLHNLHSKLSNIMQQVINN